MISAMQLVKLLMNEIQLKNLIGFGSSAIVYIATYKPLKIPVAIKMIELDRFERNQIDELRKEILVMSLCKNENLLQVSSLLEVLEFQLFIDP